MLWWAPVALAVLAARARATCWSHIGLFFSKLAVVSFGGAYALLAYMAQQAVETYRWMSAAEMVDGLGLAETLPGPLIKVTQFVGFLGAWRDPAPFSPLAAGILGSALTTWVTFVPPMLLIFAFAPFVEQLRANQRLSGALAAITAAVVGVILNLTLWFALHVLFARVEVVRAGPLRAYAPDLATLDWKGGDARPGGGRADARPASRPDRDGCGHGAARYPSALLPLRETPWPPTSSPRSKSPTPRRYEEYRKQVLAVVTKYGGKFIVRGGQVESKEGGWKPERMIALEFPSMEQALKWYDSPEYAPLIKLRQKAVEGEADHRRRCLEKRKGVRRRPSGLLLLRDSSAALDHGAGAARAGVAGGLRLVVVGLHVDDQAAADDAVRAGRRR